MLTTPHALVGLAIIKYFPNPLGLVLAFLSHYLIDFSLPHWNPHIYTEFKKQGRISSTSFRIIILDGLIAVAFTLFVMWTSLPNLGLAFLYGIGSFIAVLPDALEIPYYFFGIKSKFLKKYASLCHRFQVDASFFWGVLTQILVILACLKVLFY